MMYSTAAACLHAAAFSMTLLALLAFLRLRPSIPSRFGAAFLAAAALQALGDRFFLSLPFPLNLVGMAAQAATIPLFWLFASAWFNDSFGPRWWHWLIVAGFGIAEIAATLAGADTVAHRMIDFVTTVTGSFLALHAMWLSWAGREQDLVEHRRQLRAQFVVIVALLIVWWLWTNALSPQDGDISPLGIANDGLLAGVTLLLTAMLTGLRHPDIFPSSKKMPENVDRKASFLAPPVADDMIPSGTRERLDHLIREERLYREPGLTIGSLAVRLDLPEYRLRRYINGALGYRNFSEYLNSHRIAEVREALADPSQSEVPILTVALDAGFGSLPAFNRAFKSVCGETPTEFRKKQGSRG